MRTFQTLWREVSAGAEWGWTISTNAKAQERCTMARKASRHRVTALTQLASIWSPCAASPMMAVFGAFASRDRAHTAERMAPRLGIDEQRGEKLVVTRSMQRGEEIGRNQWAPIPHI